MTGTVKRLVVKQMFGFIELDNRGPDHFFHRDDFDGHWNDLVDDFESGKIIKVEFDSVKGRKGPRAENMRRLDSGVPV